MALITCMECGKPVSDQAIACPSCGAPTGTGKKGSSGKVLWIVLAVIVAPIVLFVGSAVVAGIAEGVKRTSSASSQPYTGKLRIDAGTEYQLLEEPSSIGGECAGWNVVSIQAPGNAASGMRELMCWRHSGSQIEVNTATGQGRRSDSRANFVD